MKRCIYHYPNPIVDKPGIGSALRPYQMLNAFREIGYEVELVTGYSAERKQKIAQVKEKIRSGVEYDFVYSESVNDPTAMTDQDHIPRHPFMDFHFFKFCRKQGIPVGLFYRDIHWMFPLFKETVSVWKRMILVPMFRFDQKMYREVLDILYVPSEAMGQFLPGFHCIPLPPGGVMHSQVLEHRAERPQHAGELHIFYVGNVTGGVYDLRKFCQAVKETPGVRLTMCAPESAWEQAKEKYASVMCERIDVVHKASHELMPYFEWADIFTCCLETNEYVRIAMPIKVFEATGYGIPVLITDGVAAADLICREKRGWSVDYSVESIKCVLTDLLNHPQKIKMAARNTIQAAPNHTWASRAQQVANDLTAMNEKEK